MHELKAPSLMTLAGEGLALFELPRLFATSPALARERRDSGEPVLALPVLGASNSSTTLLHGYLSRLGYNVQGWNQRRNRGNVPDMLSRVADQLRSLHVRSPTQEWRIREQGTGSASAEIIRDLEGDFGPPPSLLHSSPIAII
jgi:hypothetical protein